MRIEDKSGKEITSLTEWEAIQQRRQWKQDRSACSVAKFILHHNGGDLIAQRISEVLGYKVTFERVVPELELRFDHYGRGRVHDLGVFGHTESGAKLFVGVEAKVDEPFGALVSDIHLSAKSKQLAEKSTKLPARIEYLLSRYFSEADPTMFDVLYQLLYAIAGTVAADADVHVLYVIVFKTLLYNEAKGAENYRDYVQFMNKVGDSSLQLQTKEATGHRLNLKDKELICLYEYFQL